MRISPLGRGRVKVHHTHYGLLNEFYSYPHVWVKVRGHILFFSDLPVLFGFD